jgi:hypothetical protein
MFLPFEMSLSYWISQGAVYSWEPEPLVTDPEGCATEVQAADDPLGTDADGAAAFTPRGLPAMRLVFKGVKWTACPVFGVRENVAWDQVSQTHREADEDKRDDNRREARKARPPVPETKAD